MRQVQHERVSGGSRSRHGRRVFPVRRLFAGVLCLAMVCAVGCGARRAKQLSDEGDIYLRLGRVPDAMAAFEKALAADPDSVPAKLGLARCLWLSERGEEALGIYDEAIALDPTLEPAYYEAVQIHLTLHDTKAAEARADALEKVNAPRGIALRAYVLRRTGRLKEAIALLRQLVQEDGDSVSLRMRLSSALLENDQPDKAERELRRILVKAGEGEDALRARMLLIQVCDVQGKLDEMITQLEKLVEERPGDVRPKLALARSLMQTGRFDEAMTIARPILEQTPESGWANFIVGSCLIEEESYAEAVECLQAAAHALPHEEEVQRKLAQAQAGGAEAPLPPPTSAVGDEAAGKGWRTWWEAGALHQLLSERETALAEGGEEARRALVLAGVFVGQVELANELAEGLAEDDGCRRYAILMKAPEFEGLSRLMSEWKEDTAEGQLLKTNAHGYGLAVLGVRARALGLFSECLNNWPENGVAVYNIATMYRFARMPEFAARSLQKLIAVHQDNIEARELLVAVLLEAGKKEEARSVAEATYSLYPQRRESILNLAQMYLETGDIELALTVLEKGGESVAGEQHIQAALVWALLRAGRPEEALTTLEGLTLEPPLQQQAVVAEAFAAAALNDWPRVEALYDAGSTSVPMRLLASSALIRSGKIDAACAALVKEDGETPIDRWNAPILLASLGRTLENIAERDATFAQALVGNTEAVATLAYAAACSESFLPASAFAAYKELDRVMPGVPRVVARLLAALARANRMSGRLDLGKSYAEKYPDLAEAWIGLAGLYKTLGEMDECYAALSQAVSVAPDNALAWFQRAQALQENEQMEEALACYRRLFELTPEDPYVLNNLAYCILATGGDAAEALRLAKAAQEKVPGNPHVLHTLGLAEFRSGETEEGQKHLTIALQIRPGDPTILLDLGQLLVSRGQTDEGMRYVELAVQYSEQLGLDFPRKAEAEAILATAGE